MVVPLSGQFNINTVHVNAGGSSTTQVSLNDSDVRAMANVSSGAISMNDCRGGTTITQGNNSNTSYGYSAGLGNGPSFGSIADDDIFVTASVKAIYFTNIVVKGGSFQNFYVAITGNRAQNAFSSVYESSLGTLATSSASHSYSSQYGYTLWNWSLSSVPSNWDGSGALKVKLNP